MKERVTLQAHIPHTQTLLESAANNDCQCHTLMMGNQTENHFGILVITD